MAIVQQFYLTNTSNGHSKFYEVNIEQPFPGAKFELKARYGVIGKGGKWRTISKHTSREGYAGADRAVQKVINVKKGRGYKEMAKDAIPLPTTQVDKKLIGKTYLNRFGDLE